MITAIRVSAAVLVLAVSLFTAPVETEPALTPAQEYFSAPTQAVTSAAHASYTETANFYCLHTPTAQQTPGFCS